MIVRWLLILALLLAATPALGKPAPPPVAEPACTTRVAPPAPFARFGQARGPSTYLAVGQPRRVSLVPVRNIRFAAPPERAPGRGAVGAVLPVRIARAGTYRVALSGPLWIDMVSGTRRVASSANTQGPRCSGIRKIVDFRLSPGLHRVQLAASRTVVGDRQASVMIVRR